jgi:hypothetical protein
MCLLERVGISRGFEAEWCAPKAGALPGCATPRLYCFPDSKPLQTTEPPTGQRRPTTSRGPAWLYFPSIPFFTFAVGGFGPSQTDKSTGLKAAPAMVNLSLPLMTRVVPVPGT